MKLLFVADGPRDKATLPGLVRSILGHEFSESFERWAHLRDGGKGYERKLKFAVGLARMQKMDGVVAVADRDRDRSKDRHNALKDCRQKLRDRGIALPAAVGVADPYVDVWLLDDETAVRRGLKLDANTAVPHATKSKDPKTDLNELVSTSEFEEMMDALESIAGHVTEARSPHAKETGFADFADDCRREFESV